MPVDDPELRQQGQETRELVSLFMRYWAVQDVQKSVLLMADDVLSVVHFDHSEVGMSGEIKGRDDVAKGLYANLATWFYRTFEWEIAAVAGDTCRVQVNFEYQHQKTSLRHEGTMRMIMVVADGFISRVDCHHDGPRVRAFFNLVAAATAKLEKNGVGAA